MNGLRQPISQCKTVVPTAVRRPLYCEGMSNRRNAVERAVVVSKERKIIPNDLPIFRPEYCLDAPGKSLMEVERGHISQVLQDNQWNISRSAEILGIDRSTLYNKINRYKLQKPS